MSYVKSDLICMQKRLEEMDRRLMFFEQLVYRDYLRLLDLYKENLSDTERHKHYLV